MSGVRVPPPLPIFPFLTVSIDRLEDVDVVMAHTDNNVHASKVRKALSEASQRVVALFTEEGVYLALFVKHVCRNVTASGGGMCITDFVAPLFSVPASH